jgi:Protein of unknown function (DUF1778)/Ubiquinol-cytochrome C chaperone
MPAPRRRGVIRPGAKVVGPGWARFSLAAVGTSGTVGTMSEKKALNLRFKTPDQHRAITAAAQAEGVSVQDYVLEAALRRALAVQDQFVAAGLAAYAHTAADWADLDPDDAHRDPAAREREQHAARLLADAERAEARRGHAA